MNEFADDALERSESVVGEILKSLAAIVWSTDSEGRRAILLAGPLARMSKASHAEADSVMERDRLRSAIHEDDREVYLARWKHAFQKHVPFHVAYRIGPIEGEYRYYFDRGVPRFADDGQYLGHGGLAIEVSSLLLEKVSQTFVGAAGGVASWDWDLVKSKTTWSREHERMFGFAPGTFRGTYREFMDRVHPEDRAGVEMAIQVARQNQCAYSHQYRIRLPNGAVRWIAGNGQFYYDANGRPVRMRGIVVDVTDQVEAEAQRRELSERFRFVALATNDAIWDWNLITNQVWWNEGIRTLFGYPLDEVGANSNWWLVNIHPEDRDQVSASIHGAIDHGGETWKGEYRFRRHDGTYIYVADHGYIVRDATGKGVRMVGAMINISDRKRAEAERQRLEGRIQHAQKLESLGVLAGGIAHDFNNLLTGILGNASLALAELRPESPARATVRQIEVAAVRAAELTRQMLAYSGKGRFIVQPINLSHVVEEMFGLLDTVISKRAVLRFDFAPNLPSIDADATQIRQVVMNLITNASDAIGERSGIIAVRTGVMHTDDHYFSSTCLDDDLPAGFYVYLEVSDTGCGMDEATVKRIFDPFFTTKFTGRGLGLAAVMGIVRGHRGAIKVYSEPARGTTFKVLFPCAEREAVKEEPISSSAGTWRGSGTILVVDDEESVRAVARKALEKSGFQVVVARDGQECLDIFSRRKEEILVVLLDLTMPRMGGEETFRELRRLRADVRAVLMSGYNEEEVTSQFIGKGIAGFVQKPFRAAELLQAIRQAIGPS